jgi:hypothetical protein
LNFSLSRATHKNGIEVNFTSILMSVCKSIKTWFRRTWQSPSNAHAYRLYVVNDPLCNHQTYRLSLRLAVISEALNYDMLSKDLSIFRVFTDCRLANWLALLFATFNRCTSPRKHVFVSEALYCSTLFWPFPNLFGDSHFAVNRVIRPSAVQQRRGRSIAAKRRRLRRRGWLDKERPSISRVAG